MLKLFVENLDEIDSTNDELKRRTQFDNMPEGYTLVANKQLKGRGQRGNEWVSSYGNNLTFSVFLKPSFLQNSELFNLQRTISLAVCRTVEDILEVDVQIKWPNDILVNDKKIAGILVENIFQKGAFSSIIGIGLNVNQVFGKNLPFATSIRMESDTISSIPDVLAKFFYYLKYYYQLMRNNSQEIIDEYNSLIYGLGTEHEFLNKLNGKTIEGIVMGVDPSGRLILNVNNKIEYHLNGELILQRKPLL